MFSQLALYPWIHGDPQNVLNGQLDGCFPYDGTEKLAITPSASAETAEVQKVSFGTTGTGGNYFLSYRGDVTVPLAYNATAATVQAAIRNLSTVLRENLTIGASGTADVEGAIDLNVSNLRRIPSTSGGIILGHSGSVVNGATHLSPVTSVTTTGVVDSPLSGKGFTTGTYKVNGYFYRLKQIRINGDAIEVFDKK